jgi:xylulokinase
VARFIGLDVGTTALKGVVVTDDGSTVGRAEAAYPLDLPQPRWSEQDPELWWQACRTVLGQLGHADGIGLAGQMHGLVALDDALRPLRPAILWNDGRSAAECQEIERRIGFERLVALTGNRPLAGFTAPKLLWMQRHEPEVFRRIVHVMLPKDYVRMRLTREIATEVSDASGTLLFDVGKRAWSDEMAAALDVPRSVLPPALESSALAGTADGVPVAAGAGDQAAAGVGIGAIGPGPASIVVGTSGVVFAALERYQVDPQARLHTFCHARPDTWHAMGVMLSAAGSMRWLRDTLDPALPFDELSAEAGRWPPGAGGMLFLPYLSGERTPHADPEARAAFLGLGLEHDRGALVRAVMEGVAYGLRDSLELLYEVGARPEVGRVSGGGARSELWLRIIAAVLGIPVERMAVEEGSAYGAALLGAVAAGAHRSVDDAVAAWVRPVERIEPDPDWRDAYEDGYRRFREAYAPVRGTLPGGPEASGS